MVKVTDVLERAPVCVTVVGVVTSLAPQKYALVVVGNVSVTVEAPVDPVQTKSPAIAPPFLVEVVAHAPVPLAMV